MILVIREKMDIKITSGVVTDTPCMGFQHFQIRSIDGTNVTLVAASLYINLNS